MRTLAAFLCLLPWLTLAQVPTMPGGAVPWFKLKSSQDLASVGLMYWWDSSDLPAGPVTNWVDKVSSLTFSNGNNANRPVASAAGVTFTAASSHFLTNATWWTNAASANWLGTGIVQVIISETTTSVGQDVFCNYPGTGVKPTILMFTGRPRYYYDGSTASCYVPTSIGTGNTVDVIFVTDFSTGNGKIYTNGVLGVTGIGFMQFAGIGKLGHGPDGYFNGVIKEIRFLTNWWGHTNIAVYHNYATNKWGFSP